MDQKPDELNPHSPDAPREEEDIYPLEDRRQNPREAPPEAADGEPEESSPPNEDSESAQHDDATDSHSAEGDDKQMDEAAKDPWEPIRLEGEGVTECPSCGAAMPGSDEVVCLRCGFDLIQNRAIDTATGVHEVEPEEVEEDKPKPPLTTPGFGEYQVPAIIAGFAVFVMTVAYLIGWAGLYTPGVYLNDAGLQVRSTPEFITRVQFLLRFYVVVAALALSVLGGLHFAARLTLRTVGDNRLAAVRCLAIASVALIFLLVPAPPIWGSLVWEFLIEFVLAAATIIGLLMLAFDLPRRDAVVVATVAAIMVAALRAVLAIITWVM